MFVKMVVIAAAAAAAPGLNDAEKYRIPIPPAGDAVCDEGRKICVLRYEDAMDLKKGYDKSQELQERVNKLEARPCSPSIERRT